MATVASIIVSMLENASIDRAFSVSGESYLGLLDELERRGTIDVVTCRHEGGAALMAVADAKLSGRPGVCMVSRGPGASNAAIGVHAALHDSAPFILLVGQVPREHLRRDAFQEVDYGKLFNGTAKWTGEIADPARAADIMSRAIHAACSGGPGPVIVSLPENVLNEEAGTRVPNARRPARAGPDPNALDRACELLRRARRPLVIAGGELATEGGRAALLQAAEAWRVPISCSFRRHDLFPNDHPLFAGELGLFNTPAQLRRLEDSDLILAVGTRLGDMTTNGYTFPASPQPRQPLVHVHQDPAAIGSNHVPDVATACDARLFLEALTARANASSDNDPDWAADLRGIFESNSTWMRRESADGVVFGNVVSALQRHVTPDAIVSMDAGVSAGLMYRYFCWRPPQTLLTPVAGTMGWGIPGAVAAALRFPDRQVVAMVGDGGMLMNGMELAAAGERRLPITVILANNGSYGAIRANLDRAFPGRRTATDLWNPDFQLLARAFGCRTFCIRSENDVVPVLDEAFAERGLTFVEVRTSLQAVLPRHVTATAAAAQSPALAHIEAGES